MDRDLKADQEICAHFNKLVKQGVYEKGSLASHESVREILKFALVANEGWPYAINRLYDMQERAEKAEVLVLELADNMKEAIDNCEVCCRQSGGGALRVLYECVKRIIGQIEPTGDSGIDKVRLANFQEQCKVTLDLMQDIVFISHYYRSKEASVREINGLALKTIKEFKEVLGDE